MHLINDLVHVNVPSSPKENEVVIEEEDADDSISMI